jgi:hypothetical protein
MASSSSSSNHNAPDAGVMSCTRCLEPTTSNGGVCRVPHPGHLLSDGGKFFGGDQTMLSFQCEACKQVFTKSKRFLSTDDWIFKPPTAQWCFKGKHTIKTLKAGELRKIYNDVVTINVALDDATENIQEQLAQMDAAKVLILVIQSADGGYAEDVNPCLDLDMPLLEEIKLLDVCFAKIVLNATKTPKLRNIELQNLPDACEVEIKCPSLKQFDCRYHNGDCLWVQEMLHVAVSLQDLRMYKVVVDELCIASNELKQVIITRSDCLFDLTIFAPRLQHLQLQCCYALQRLTIVDKHPTLSLALPAKFKPSKIDVDTRMSCLSPAVKSTLRSNPRVEWDDDDDVSL